jgi:hypothetical protein
MQSAYGIWVNGSELHAPYGDRSLRGGDKETKVFRGVDDTPPSNKSNLSSGNQ